MDQKRSLEQNIVSGKLFLVGFVVLFVVIGGLLYLNPEKGSVFDGKEAQFQGVTGAAVGDPEICTNNVDDNADFFIDCNDYEECGKGVTCSTSGSTLKKCVWSHINSPDSPVQRGCCQSTQCWSNNPSGCYNYDNNLPSSSPVVNCGSTNDWDYCGADPSFSKHPGDFSDGGKYQCVQEGGSYKWKLVCNQDTKYKSNPLSSIANEICDGTRWRQCVDDLDLTPIYDPNVIITCVGYVAQAHEYNCNNNIDDNNNEKTDEADFDCQKTSIDYYLNTYRYEVTIKVGDAYGTNLKT